MRVFYNDIEPYCIAWLKRMVEADFLGRGIVSERSIKELEAIDLGRFDRVHLFAGIGGWEYALQLARWPESVPVWTGSCPCQPFSTAGTRKGTNDERHLWPDMFRLIQKHKPGIVFGEQVAGKDGRAWLDLVFTDLESEGYTCWACDLAAAGIGAPHIRQRLYWVAISNKEPFRAQECRSYDRAKGIAEGETQQWKRIRSDIGTSSTPSGMDYANDSGCGKTERATIKEGLQSGSEQGRQLHSRPEGLSRLVDTDSTRQQRRERIGSRDQIEIRQTSLADRLEHANVIECNRQKPRSEQVHESCDWANIELIQCRDGKHRPISVESCDAPLAYGLPQNTRSLIARMGKLGIDAKTASRIIAHARRNRVGRIRGYGNAIVPVLAAKFIETVKEILIKSRNN